MNRTTKTLKRAASKASVAMTFTCICASEALDQSADWAQPIQNIFDDVYDGILIIGASILAVAVALVGINYYFQREFDMRKLYPIAVGAILLFFGAQALNLLLN